MESVLRNERGIALGLAIVALVVSGAIIAGALFVGTQEQRLGENARRVQQSFGVAEGGAYDVLRAVKPESLNAKQLYPADSYQIASTTTPTGGSYGGTVYKLNQSLYLVNITGQDRVSLGGSLKRIGGARQRIGMLARVLPMTFPGNAALVSGTGVDLAGQSAADGNDHTPPNWSGCAALGPGAPGIRTPDTVTINNNASYTGNPPAVYHDSTVQPSSFTQFGSVSYSDLVAKANITLSPGVTYTTQPVTTKGKNPVCDLTVLTNWGDPQNPTTPCGTYFPIIHITGAGSTTLNGVEGQGILLVDGDLNVQGGFEWYGVTIIQGELKTSGGGTTPAHFWGAVLAASTSKYGLGGQAILNYSACAIARVTANVGLSTSLLRSRSWVQLF